MSTALAGNRTDGGAPAKKHNLMASRVVARNQSLTNTGFGLQAGYESILSPRIEKKAPFEFTGMEIPKKEGGFNADRLVQVPSYRGRRHKFDFTKTECINEKNNDPMTM